jgi:hypothetical protein
MRVLEDYRKYPNCPKEFPDELLNEEQAQKNHDQTLKRLNERGGLGAFEIICNIRKMSLFHKTHYNPYDTEYWINELIKITHNK